MGIIAVGLPLTASRPVNEDYDKTKKQLIPPIIDPQQTTVSSAVPREGNTLGKYQVLKELGRGAMGAVYLALDTRLNRRVALKVMLPEFAADPLAKERFLREAQAVAQVSHDHVVTVHEADELDGVTYIAMQLLRGYSLDEYLKKKGSPSISQSVRIARETALGLAAAHKRGLVHRDIKPANLWLEAPNGRVKVLDFGLAKPLGRTDRELSASGAVVGTPAYMSPEQASGRKVDHRTDIFSLGIVLYRLLTGRSPFNGEHVLAMLTALAVEEPTPVCELNPKVPPALATLVHQMLAKKPEARPQTATEVAERLSTVFSQADAEISASQPIVLEAIPVAMPAIPAPEPMEITAIRNSVAAVPDASYHDEPTDEDTAPLRNRTTPPKAKNRTIYTLAFVAMIGVLGVGIVAILNARNSNPQGDKEKETLTDKDQTNTGYTPLPKGTNTAFPRRILFMSVSRYMYLNPLTTGSQGIDRTASTASNLGFVWRVPVEKENNQLFVLSDTAKATMDRLPMKNVIQGTYLEFFKTSRAQDRVLVYFGGHAIEKGGKAYIAPMEAELDGEEWENTLIPLESFYEEMKKCKATQKVVVWDVCRYNPERGRVRPGSEPMSEALYKALTTAPPGIQVITTCKAGENALEFSQLRPEGFGVNAPVYSGSVFLESLKYVGSPANKALPKVTPNQGDPLPIVDWHPMIAKRVKEMCDIAEKLGNGGKQTVTLTGTAPASLAAPDGAEKVAARFEFPQAPKGASQAEIQAVEREFTLPPLKPDLAAVNIADFPFPSNVMKDFGTDVQLDEITKDKEKYKLRNAVLDTFNILRAKWSTGAGTTNIRNKVEGGVNDTLKAEVKREQDFWATSIAELYLQLLTLEGVASLKESETKRWQANYDFALASLKARLAYMYEYNRLLGNLITETIPALDAKLGQDGYILVASETLKSSEEVKNMAKEAQALFAEIATKYKGTPWAIQAKQEKNVAIGLTWKATSLK